ncbi:GH36-type glycosyl hydrolase domain-containing protein [Brumicola nitratireducens]|uniref:Glycosyltransferase 36 n=1 Tax=Glaciecola nitratireducens (strain JCM 12485 / KCTC 12276 / FR1064) TaxID=1085623 RepID=G4QN44_GLANF|nr:glucoamylase family protein [Glaciecola nitratireducens]AEP31463.1 glycosyltransferase 36 [Glaciecola nitratireducens FR1064]
MNVKTSLNKIFRRFTQLRWKPKSPLPVQQTPMRAELLNTEQMKKHAIALAKRHEIDRFNTRDQLLSRLDSNEQVLIDTNHLLANAIKSKQTIAPSGEWLLDNFYLIEEQIRTARLHLPKGYSKELPRLAKGNSSGLPRVYDIALNVISHGDGRVDAEIFAHFVEAYQTVTPLKLGELWAIPIMLRLALIENLRRASVRITTSRQYVNLAQQWAHKMLEMAENDPQNLILVIADMARSKPLLSSAFVAELTRKLQGHGSALALPLTWIEQKLAESSLTIEQMIQIETQQQAADQVSVSNTIGSLRWLTAMDWRDFVEANSRVEQILRQDQSGHYSAMDFATRDSYRQVVDRLAKRCSYSEIEIAKKALALTQEDTSEVKGAKEPTGHVGYYLVDRGITQLESEIKVKKSIRTRIRFFVRGMPLILYLGSIAGLTGLSSIALFALAGQIDITDWRFLLLGFVSLLSASQLASALVNWLATILVEPKRMPRMDYSKGLPPAMQTLVVIPSMLSSAQGIESLLEILEVRFLGNRDQHLHFALLTDFHDAPEKTQASDQALLQQARAGIEQLNAKYPVSTPSLPDQAERFFLLHRPRTWNKQEKSWMGCERKRGKLGDLNALLRGKHRERFSLIVGNISALTQVKYVITLDTDTLLPRDCAHQLVGAMAHPLNQPRFDSQKQCVIGGYGILQPRMAASISGKNPSRYSQLCGEEPGIDPYTRSISDVYQDLFGEGSYIGKGIYDLDAFESSLNNRLPENQILSHDLLEGCYTRSGLLSDVHMYEEYPSRYDVDMCRRERWIRGDWQIAHWLLPWVPDATGNSIHNPLSPLSRWKIFDNLRRSIEPLAIMLTLLMGWWLVPNATTWTFAVLAIFFLPPVFTALIAAYRKPNEMRISHHLHSVLRDFVHQLAQAGFRIACLPHEAVFNVSAILRSIWRMLFTRRRLLEWQLSEEQPKQGSNELLRSFRTMWAAPTIAIFSAFIIISVYTQKTDSGFVWSTDSISNLVALFPILLLWFFSPAVAWWLSLPQFRLETTLEPEQTAFLHNIARKTWAFFDHFSSIDDNWLIPDNFQEQPGPVTAHRTSPTNIGLSLLASVSAYDFGFIPAGVLLQRCTDCFTTLDKLDRHKGHFYNWYDTQSLEVLPPRYISSVDSGNLAGHLLTLRLALLELPDQSIFHPRVYSGISTTLDIVENSYSDEQQHFKSASNSNEDFNFPSDAILAMRKLLNSIRPQKAFSIQQVVLHLITLSDAAETIKTSLQSGLHNVTLSQSKRWAEDLHQQCLSALQELRLLTPWLSLQHAPRNLASFAKPFMQESKICTMRQLSEACSKYILTIDLQLALEITEQDRQWLKALREHVTVGLEVAKQRITTSEQLAERASKFADMEFAFLYDDTRNLLAIGYNVDDQRRDTSYYDLLASEVRLGSFVAIAQGQLPQESWFALSRLQTSAGGEPVLVSWSGSMFEYLMPMLVMPTYPGTLLEQTCRAAVARQIAYGKMRAVPWGVSESGYNTVDASLNYQYSAFGVPGLGLKRGLSEDLVVAPYSSVLALMVAPEAACENLQKLAANGMLGQYGFYEAIDYTKARLLHDQTSAIIPSFMAHHQGMSLLALSYHLLKRPMQRRFESDPMFKSALLLLQERIPKTSIFQPHIEQHAESGVLFEHPEVSVNTPITAQTSAPEVQLLSNGNYHVMLTNTGSGYSRWHDLAVTRWREDATCENWGTFIYVRNTSSNHFWSATYQPTLKPAQSYDALFSGGRAEFRRCDHDIETYSEIVVSPEDDIELRRIRICNHTNTHCELDLTTYAEVVMALPSSDNTHPSFSNLFVQTEIIANGQAILCSRRARAADEETPWMFHLLVPHGNGDGVSIGKVSSTTDRLEFIGRGRSLVSPQALLASGDLSGSDGSVLDPIVSIRCPLSLDSGLTATLDLVTGMANSREECLALIGKYQDRHLTDRVLDLAWTHSSVALHQINVNESDVLLYRRLAGSIIYPNISLRADAAILAQNRRGQSGLWAHSISGDLPIVLLKISSSQHIELVRQLIQCHSYWRLRGLVVDLVIWNEEQMGYRQLLQDHIMGLITSGTEAKYINRRGGIFVRSGEQISSEDRILLQAVARAVIIDTQGTLADQINRRVLTEKRVASLKPSNTFRLKKPEPQRAPEQNLQLNNGLGGFSSDGREYVITTSATNKTPLPWVNVLANSQFGTVVAESGQAYTWSENAHEYRLTPWSEDSVGASGGEAFYLRDEDSGYFWSPTPMPCTGTTPYVTRHGFGYSIFEHTEDGIESELCVFVDLNEAVKFSVLKIRNHSGSKRRLTATGYVEWVLDEQRAKSAMHVVTEIDAQSGALFARNAYNSEFGDRVAFFDVDNMSRSLSGDRSEFIGRNGTLQRPDAMTRERLPGRLGAALDPCGAIQVPFELANGEEKRIIFRLGAGKNLHKARSLALKLRETGSARRALENVHHFWQKTLNTVQVTTPDPAINIMTNGWLVYQTLACRFWARSGFYQSGGAFGFRDQLQDAMALLHTQPKLLREHLLTSASRQYLEGDVQHWWHPPVGRGVRTRCSDDYLWLPLATCRYVIGTGDIEVLDELAPFIAGRELNDDEESYYDLPTTTHEKSTLYQHCVLSILHGLRFGEKGLPLMGSGDWNDGMSTVGIEGKGESVWLGFFLYKILQEFADVADLYKDDAFSEHCRNEADKLQKNLAKHGWDGAWYRRAWFDDGTPLGSSISPECTIDSIAQSWSVLSGAGDKERTIQAMNSLDEHLVRRDEKIIQLLEPPFDKSEMNPGYIKGYVPGVRENGGQYTHAAIWATMAFAQMGDSKRAWELMNIINPLNHGLSAEQVATYKAEPYVVAADVYAVEPHIGRGGWTWYTGSAGWMYRLIVESLLGITLEGERLKIVPCIPKAWTTYSVDYTFGSTQYHIIIKQNQSDKKPAEITMTLDGHTITPPYVPLMDDQVDHEVMLTLRQEQNR